MCKFNPCVGIGGCFKREGVKVVVYLVGFEEGPRFSYIQVQGCCRWHNILFSGFR